MDRISGIEPHTIGLTCPSMVLYCIAGSSTVDGHHRDSVGCVTDHSSEGVGVH